MSAIFFLIDCNNFYCSCERVFKPNLNDKPVIVLSNNDGCIIARSNEAKKLNIPMGAPYFKYKNLIKKEQIQVFSSNYQLYGDMSNRVMNIIKSFSPYIEFYSIDEAFIRVNNLNIKNYEEYANNIKDRIAKYTGIPVSIGIARSKTLAKIANHIAKKNNHIYSLLNKDTQDNILKKFPIDEIWGIGRNLAPKLKSQQIFTAADLKNSNTMLMRKYYSVTLEKTIRELQEINCLDLEESKAKKNIISSKSFAKPITEKYELRQAIANYAARACKKLRQQQGQAQAIYLFIKTNKFSTYKKQYQNHVIKGFINPTSNTQTILTYSKIMLDEIYKPGYEYHKAGIILLNIIDQNIVQYDLFSKNPNNEKHNKLAHIIDDINKLTGQEIVKFAIQGNNPWQQKNQYRSPCYTTKWDELVTAS